jgi:preprotein translocase subunit SecG
MMNNVWMNLALGVQLISALAVIGLVLVQHGKGADMGASFGSGASGSLFGATGSANFLSRSTAIAAAVFFASTLTMAMGSIKAGKPAVDAGSSVLEKTLTPPPTAPGGVPPASPGVAPSAAPAAVPATTGGAAVPPTTSTGSAVPSTAPVVPSATPGTTTPSAQPPSVPTAPASGAAPR